jgi:hypothetical protein
VAAGAGAPAEAGDAVEPATADVPPDWLDVPQPASSRDATNKGAATSFRMEIPQKMTPARARSGLSQGGDPRRRRPELSCYRLPWHNESHRAEAVHLLGGVKDSMRSIADPFARQATHNRRNFNCTDVSPVCLTSRLGLRGSFHTLPSLASFIFRCCEYRVVSTERASPRANVSTLPKLFADVAYLSNWR